MKQVALISMLLLFSAFELFSQIVISGSVRYAKDLSVVDLANVIIEDTEKNTVIGSAVTSPDGRFKISCKSGSSTLKLTVAGFNIARHSQIIKAQSQEVMIEVEYQEIRLTEAVIKVKPIKRTGDTLTYYVSKFSDSLDRSIGDVLKKMPGISVDKSGGIKYNGRAITKFYIEGMDMMGSRYGVATKNVQAKDIATVEVYENHQPVKMLRELNRSNPDNTAINLKLKDKSKGVLIASMQLGAGYQPWSWNGAITAMLFTGSYQMFVSAKTNNSGEDIISELVEQYDNSAQLTPYIGVYTPAKPEIDLERYMDNTTHAVSVNNLFKLSKEKLLSLNGIYYYDRQDFRDSSVTVYYMPSADPLKISEATGVRSKTNNAEMRLKFTNNGEKNYIEDVLTVQAKWNQAQGSVLTQDEEVLQRFDMNPNLGVNNKFDIVKTLKDGPTFDFSSTIGVRSLPATLRVNPLLYPSIFGYEQASAESAIQTMSNRAFYTQEHMGFSWEITPRFRFDAKVGFTLDHQTMESSLGLESGSMHPDSLDNQIISNRWNAFGTVGLNYKYKKLDIHTFVKMNYAFIKFNDKIKNTLTSQSKPFFNPSLMVNLALAPNLKLNLISDYTEDYGAVNSFYSGYIMTDYRSISTRSGEIAENRRQNHNVSLKYADAISALFASVDASYWWSRSNLMYGTIFKGNLSYIESYHINNTSQGYAVNGKVSKFFDDLFTTVELSGGYEQFWMDVLRQQQVMNTHNSTAKGGIKWITRWFRKIKTTYTPTYQYTQTKYSNKDLNATSIHALHQVLAVDYPIISKLILNLTGEHYFNSAVVSGSRNIWFLDASLMFKTKKLEYMLEGRNLLGTRVYNNSYTSAATDFEYHYLLRPASVMLKVRFNLN